MSDAKRLRRNAVLNCSPAFRRCMAMPRQHLPRFDESSSLDTSLASGLCAGRAESTYVRYSLSGLHHSMLTILDVEGRIQCICNENLKLWLFFDHLSNNLHCARSNADVSQIWQRRWIWCLTPHLLHPHCLGPAPRTLLQRNGGGKGEQIQGEP